jgi:hypothetical protein
MAPYFVRGMKRKGPSTDAVSSVEDTPAISSGQETCDQTSPKELEARAPVGSDTALADVVPRSVFVVIAFPLLSLCVL